LITVGILCAGGLVAGSITADPRNDAESGRHEPSGSRAIGSIRGAGSVPGPIQETDTRQGQQTMFSKLSSVAAATAVGVSTTIAGAQGAAVQWRTSDGGNGHWYEHVDSARTWVAAQAFAQSLGGHLATPTSAEENAFVFAASGGQGNTWIGGLQDPAACEPDCGWVWVTGEPWVYTAWRTAPDDGPGNSQPDNTRGQENHLAYWGGIPKWNDGNGNDVSAPFTIEWSADCNNDGIVDFGQLVDGTLVDTDSNGVPDCCDAGVQCIRALRVPENFATIQLAIDAAHEGDRVLVAPGTYREQVSLRGKAISVVGMGGADATTIDGEGVRVVVIGVGEPSSCELRGFTIANGRHVGDSGGGGAMLANSSARFVNCRFVGNVADGTALWSGGGHFSLGGSPAIEDCQFINNKGLNQSSGAAIYHYGGGGLMVRRCIFDRNTCNYLGSMGLDPGSTLKVHTQGAPFVGAVEDCAFIENSTGSTVIPDASSPGGEIFIFLTGVLDVTRCVMVADALPKPCAAGAAGGGSIVMTQVTGCGYPRTSNGGVNTNGASLTGGCTDGDFVPDLAAILRNQAIDSDGTGIPDVCELPTCSDADLYPNGVINGADLGILLSEWGPVTAATTSDIDGDGTVGGGDLGILLSFWGNCQG
jgi:hypothetical protein